jgi:hypothetical protein
MRRREQIAALQQTIELQKTQIVWTQALVQSAQTRLVEQERFYVDRIRELEDATRATSLDQLRGMHPTAAMELMPPEPERRFFVHDATGLISTEVDPRDVELES